MLSVRLFAPLGFLALSLQCALQRRGHALIVGALPRVLGSPLLGRVRTLLRQCRAHMRVVQPHSVRLGGEIRGEGVACSQGVVALALFLTSDCITTSVHLAHLRLRN
jgi:hypothetical protein